MDNKTSKKDFFKLYLWTLAYFKPFLGLTLVYVVSGGLLMWGELMIPRRMGYLIDHVIPQGTRGDLQEQALVLIGVVGIILVTKAIFKHLENVLANKIVRRQQTDLLVKLQDLGFAYYEKVPTGQIIGLFENSVREVQKTYTFLFPQFVYSLAQFLVPSVILIQEQPIFFFASMVGNVLYVSLNQLANKKIHHYLGKETQAAHDLQQSLYDAITSVTELKASGRGEWFIGKTMDRFKAYRNPRMGSIFWRHFRFTTVGLTLTVSTILFYVFGLELIQAGDLLLGEFIAYSFFMGLVSRGFSVFFYIVPAQYHALSYAKGLYDFMHLEPQVADLVRTAENSGESESQVASFDVSFDQVTFSYDEGQPILKKVSIVIPEGKKTAIVGESGSGKSTLLKLIGRFYDVDQGQISIGKVKLSQIPTQELRDHVGYVFQETHLFNVSIKDNIRIGNPHAQDAQVVRAAQQAMAHDFIMATEDGYDTMVGESGSRLSGGQQQRIALARMILKGSQIILLDEATSALDTQTESDVKASLNVLAQGKTLITVAHRLSTIVDYDHIIVMRAGQVVEQGTYDDLMAKQEYFYTLVMGGGQYAC